MASSRLLQRPAGGSGRAAKWRAVSQADRTPPDVFTRVDVAFTGPGTTALPRLWTNA